ncbi:MAG TPA: TIGR03619 family F420-dependent LLM class oxidoreductase, partial [Acidimicrobiales bacterium]|nr:TIGR03619 family F420-dependent LLM class oxidoreductase [Acidimicrobiales bacterium]
FGLICLPTDRSASVADLAVAAEERGFAALFQGDHTHIPSRRTTPFLAGGELPDEYSRLVDPFVGLATAAARTTTIKLGTCIFLIAQRDPISTAKQVASLDHVSNGRFVFGIGYGWNVEEAADHRIEWSTRRHRTREYVAAMRTLWTEERASFHGRFVDFDEAWMWPKPVTRPSPPVLLGAGATEPVFGEIIDWADGWLTVPALGHRTEDVVRLRQLAEDRGRDPATLSIVVDGLWADPALIEPWADLGVDMVLVPVPSKPLDTVLPLLDAALPAMARFAPVGPFIDQLAGERHEVSRGT